MSLDELEIIFGSRRAGGLGGYDLYRATRASRSDPFWTPEPIAELNSPGDDVYPSLVRDGEVIYFNYNTATAGGSDADVWRAERGCLMQAPDS